MVAIQNGSNQALDEIIARWEVPTMAYIIRIIRDPEWAEELAVETFSKLYFSASRFDPQRRFKPWIYTIASNLCRNLLRWKKRRPLVSQSLDEFEGPQSERTSLLKDHSATNPRQSSEKNERAAQIKNVIDSLPTRLQLAVVLHYYQGLTYEECAESLKCSVRGVETRLYRARKLLKEKLKNLGDLN